MNTSQLPQAALEIIMKEHAALREEIRDRLKIAFSHVAYAGAVGAFAIPLALKVPGACGWILALLAALLALAALSWVALLNMRWVQHAGAYIRWIEARVAHQFGEQILGWEHYGETARAAHFTLITTAPEPGLPSDVVFTHPTKLF